MRTLRQCWVVAMILAGMYAGGSTFNPASIFQGGVQGFLHPSVDQLFEAGCLWQDSARSTPAVVGQAIGYVDDLGGSGVDFYQSTAASRPLLLEDEAGRLHFKGDGVDDFLLSDFAPTAYPFTMLTVTQLDETNRAQGLLFTYQSGTNSVYKGVAKSSDLESWNANDRNEGNEVAQFARATFSRRYLHMGRFRSGSIELRYDGVSQERGHANTFGTPAGLMLLRRPNSITSCLNGRYYGGLMAMTDLTEDQIAGCSAHFVRKTGAVLL